MKFLCTADIHLSVYSNDKIDQNTGLPEKLQGIINALNHLINYGREHEIKTIVIAGDVNHNKSIIYSLANSILLDFVRSNNDFFFYIIDGNHDVSEKSKTAVSSLKGLDSEPNVDMIHETKQIDDILFIPWSSSLVSDVKNNQAKFLISHFGLNEAQLSNGISIVSDLKLSDLENYKHVILGHYHKPQQIKHVTYCGSLVQLDWGERNEDKRFLIVDTDSEKIESVESSGYKKFYSFSVTSENKDDVLDSAKQLQEDGHNVLVEKQDNFDLSDFEGDLKIIDRSEKDITNRGISFSMAKDSILEKYMEIQGVSEQKKERYRNVGLRIINQVKGN